MRIEKPESFLPHRKQYSELRLQENRNEKILIINGDVSSNRKDSRSGVSSRVYANGAWGFASTPETDDSSIHRVVQAAEHNADYLSRLSSLTHGPLANVEVHDDFDLRTKTTRLTGQDKLNFLKELDNTISRRYTDVSSRTVVLNSLDTEKHLISTFGTDAYSNISRTHIGVKLDIERNGECISFGKPFGGRGNFEDYFQNPENLLPDLDEIVDHLRKKAAGTQARAGTFEVILNSNLAGILAHEAVGHTTEADLVKAGSIAGDMVNQKVGSDLVYIVDYAWIRNGEICPVPIRVDDEGSPGKDVILIENGILRNFLHSKETARDYDVEPEGNGRASEFSDEPLVRMRNTAILPGKDRFEDMVASIDDGYYLMNPSNGQADLTGEFMFGVSMGYEIRNGRLGRAIRDTTISGIAFELLKTVTMLSEEMTWLNSGMCGKKQMIPVGMGGPAIKCQVHVGGRQ